MNKLIKKVTVLLFNLTIVYCLMALVIGFDNTNLIAKTIIDNILLWF